MRAGSTVGASGFGPEVTDETLVKTVLDGDMDAYGELYRRYVDQVAGYVARRTPPHAPREDLAQEAFTLALERIGEYREDAPEYKSFGQWLCGIAGCAVFKHTKRWWDARQAEEALTDALERQPAADSAPPAVAAALSEELAAKVATLPPHYRRAVELRYFEGQSVEQTAKVMGRSRRSVAGLLFRALEELRPAGVQAKRDGTLTQARLVETASQVIAERGVKGATGTEIAARVGVAPSLINLYFGSRAGLIAQAMTMATGEQGVAA